MHFSHKGNVGSKTKKITNIMTVLHQSNNNNVLIYIKSNIKLRNTIPTIKKILFYLTNKLFINLNIRMCNHD